MYLIGVSVMDPCLYHRSPVVVQDRVPDKTTAIRAVVPETADGGTESTDGPAMYSRSVSLSRASSTGRRDRPEEALLN
jgi:hypothetical protein